MKNKFLLLFLFSSFLGYSLGLKENENEYNQQVIKAMDQKNYTDLKAIFHDRKNISALNPDLAYFLALHFLEMEDIKMAQQLFDFGWKKASPTLSKMCAEKLIELEDEKKQYTTIEKYLQRYPADNAGKLNLAKFYYTKNEFQKVLNTVGIPSLPAFETPPETLHIDTPKRQKQINEQLTFENEFARLRILSLIHLQNSSFLRYLDAWVTHWKMSQSHRDFLSAWFTIPNLNDLSDLYGYQLSQIINTLQMRIAVFSQDYPQAYNYAEKIDIMARMHSANFLSDYCRAQFFSYKNPAQFREKMTTLLTATKKPSILFRVNFYLGRIYVNEKNYPKALEYFRFAMNAAPNPENYDNALWYYFDAASKISLDAVISALYAFGKTINSASYFEDFFSSLSLLLLTEKNWNTYVRVYETMRTFTQGAAITQFAYVSARLLEEGYAKLPAEGMDLQQKISAAYRHAYETDHGSLYYRILAAKKIQAPIEEISKTFYNRRKNHQFIQNNALESLLLGYARYGFPEKVLSAFLTDYNSISLPVALELSQLVYNKGTTNSHLYSDSLRIISFASSRIEMPLTKEVLQALYPRPYYEEIKKSTSRFNVSEYIFYALVRTESFFYKDVSSHAGAIGLSQLMPTTAADIARRLKVTDYDLLDAQTNTLFGAYYYSELIRRMNGSQLLALFSYNGGQTRVRSWVKANNTLPLDLFLEIVPFFETRDYGRKVLSASILYGYLYYNISANDIIDELMHRVETE
ncbi:MAG: flagellar assembly lytic transglycosylase [Treponemataceae bacterium]